MKEIGFRNRNKRGWRRFHLPTYHGELEKREDWSWQLKRYVGLHKPVAKQMMDDVEGSDGAGRLCATRTQRMDSRFGVDCTISSHCQKEREPQREPRAC